MGAVLVLVAVLGVDPQALLDEGRTAERRGYLRLAREKFSRCLELDPTMSECRLHLGGTYARLGDRKKAEEVLRGYMEVRQRVDPAGRWADEVLDGSYEVDRVPDSEAAKAVAKARKTGDVKGAQQLGEACAQKHPEDADCQLQLGLAYRALKDKKNARLHLVAFLRLSETVIHTETPQIEEW